MNPFIASSLISGAAALFGQRQQQDASVQATALANQAARLENRKARQFNKQEARKATQRNVAAYKMARDDARENAATDYRRSLEAMNKANAFTANQAQTARKWDEARREEVRGEALTDQAEQFTRLRASAEAAGFNPLAALGAGQMVPSSGPLMSSSFGASASPGLAPTQNVGMASAASVPMSYGAPVSVAPIASNDAVVGAVSEIGRELTGAAALERANAKFFSEVAAIEGDKLTAGPKAPILPDLTYPQVGGQALPALGSTAQPVGSVGATPGWNEGRAPRYWRQGDLIDDERITDQVPTDNISGIMEIENDFTGGPIGVVGSGGEPWGIDEWAAAAPQLGYGLYQNWIGKPFARWITNPSPGVGPWSGSPDPYSPMTYTQPSLGPVDDIGRPMF